MNHFDPEKFIDELLEAMNMQNEASEKQEKLRQSIKNQMGTIMMEAAAKNIQPGTLEEVDEYYKGETDPMYFFRQLVKYSPEAQVAILEELEKFKEQTLDAYQTIKQ